MNELPNKIGADSNLRLQAYNQDYNKLYEISIARGRPFTPEEITTITSRLNCSQIIDKLTQIFSTSIVLAGGLTNSQLIRVANYSIGERNLQALLDHFHRLIQHFSSEQIANMTSFKYGYKNLHAALDNYNKLIVNFSPEQIVHIVSFNGGYKNLEVVADYYDKLIVYFSRKQIIRMVSYVNGGENLQAVIENFYNLVPHKFNIEQIVNLASSNVGGKNIEFVSRYYDVLFNAGFLNDYIIKTLSKGRGINKLYKQVQNVVKKQPQIQPKISSDIPVSNAQTDFGHEQHTNTYVQEQNISQNLDCLSANNIGIMPVDMPQSVLVETNPFDLLETDLLEFLATDPLDLPETNLVSSLDANLTEQFEIELQDLLGILDCTESNKLSSENHEFLDTNALVNQDIGNEEQQDIYEILNVHADNDIFLQTSQEQTLNTFAQAEGFFTQKRRMDEESQDSERRFRARI